VPADVCVVPVVSSAPAIAASIKTIERVADLPNLPPMLFLLASHAKPPIATLSARLPNGIIDVIGETALAIQPRAAPYPPAIATSMNPTLLDAERELARRNDRATVRRARRAKLNRRRRAIYFFPRRK